MKLLLAILIITLSIFINWTYSQPNEKAGITGHGMKSEIKDRVLAEQEDYTYTCEEIRGSICIKPVYRFDNERTRLLELLE